jgi:hypothetical protein
MAGAADLATLVAEYQGGKYQASADARVKLWLTGFASALRTPIAEELAHVLGLAFLSHKQAVSSVRRWLKRPSEVSWGLVETWNDATFLSVQTAGGSQRALMKLLDAEAAKLDQQPVSACTGSKLFVYVDDVSVHGMRLLKDLKPWIKNKAPRKGELLVLLQRRRFGNQEYLNEQLMDCAFDAGKTMRVNWWVDLEFSSDDCYSPMALPDDPDLTHYLKDSGVSPQLRTSDGVGQYFSSEAGRELLEREFLLAGVRVLEANPNLSPKKYMRPLGNTIWKGLGLGVPIVTWRNCPNSAPLCLWAEGHVPPLFPREAN